MSFTNLNIGDIIVRQKGIWSTHYMVYVGVQNGIRTVAENQDKFGVRFISLEQALKNKSVLQIEKFNGTEQERLMVIPKAMQLLGKAYDLVSFNYEHFARLITQGKIKSRQVDLVSSLALLVGVSFSLGSLTSKKNSFLMIPAALCFLVAIVISLMQNHD